MADFAPNFTPRYVLTYSVLGHVHRNLWRIARGAGPAEINALVLKLAAFYNAFSSSRFTDWTALSATFTPEDSDISVPTAIPAIAAGTAPIPTNSKSEGILSTCFLGRSNLGQKARVFVYGLAVSPEVAGAAQDDFRLTTSESAAISSAVTVLNNGSPNLVASDNSIVGWYSYVDLKYNDYWLRKVRS